MFASYIIYHLWFLPTFKDMENNQTLNTIVLEQCKIRKEKLLYSICSNWAVSYAETKADLILKIYQTREFWWNEQLQEFLGPLSTYK